MKYEESHAQEQVVTALTRFYKDVLFTGGFAGERLGIGAACRRKRMGYRPGTPDIFILEARGQYHGLMIEMKSATGTLSAEQKAFRDAALARGYLYVVCHSAAEGVQAVAHYMALENGRIQL